MFYWGCNMKFQEVEDAYDMMAEGCSLQEISNALGYNKSNLYRHLVKDKERYVECQQLQAQSFVARIMDLARKAEEGDENHQSTRLAIDTYKWLACKFYPKMYGDKQLVTHSLGEKVEGIEFKVVKAKKNEADRDS